MVGLFEVMIFDEMGREFSVLSVVVDEVLWFQGVLSFFEGLFVLCGSFIWVFFGLWEVGSNQIFLFLQ